MDPCAETSRIARNKRRGQSGGLGYHLGVWTYDAAPGKCPACGASWEAGPIPEEHRALYPGKTHHRRGPIIHPKGETRLWSYARCPDCGASWDKASARSSLGKKA